MFVKAKKHCDSYSISNATWNLYQHRCGCGNCFIMETARECKCCLGIPDVARIVRQENVECITKHESFVANCLNRHVLEVSYFEYIQDDGHLGDEPVHE